MAQDLAKETVRIGTIARYSPQYLKQVVQHGFESFELGMGAEVREMDLKKLAREIKETIQDSGAVISALGVYANPLGDQKADLVARETWKLMIDNAHLFGTDLVCGFAGRVRNEPIEASMKQYKKIFGPLARRAADKGVRLAFENCEMGGTWQSGDWNIAHTPRAWEMMFNELPMDNIGLEWEPCHQMVKLIDPMPQLRKWVKKIFHVHGKDATILWDVIREHGIHGGGSFAHHRTPGFGDSNWADIISELRLGGFKGSIDIEGWHDPVYSGDLEMTGQVHGLQYLKFCRGGNYIPNPTT